MKPGERLIYHNLDQSNDWPIQAKIALDNFLEAMKDVEDFTIICVVAAKHQKPRAISAAFSELASASEYKVDMCKDLAEMFQDIAARLSQ